MYYKSDFGLCVIISVYLLGLTFFSVLLMCQTAAAQTDEEMAMLRLFYEEKDLMILPPTRHPKRVSEAAEHISVVKIEAMNAHTVAEVLNRGPGLFLSSFCYDLCSGTVTEIQASGDIHVLFLLDGMPWIFLSGGAMFNVIPVGDP